MAFHPGCTWAARREGFNLMRMTFFITGITGFVGAEVAVRLIQSGHEVHGLIRARDLDEAHERLHDTFRSRYESTADELALLNPVLGDVTAPDLGLSDLDHRRLISRVTHVVHCAATVNFDVPMLEALRVNTVGTRHVLDVSRAIADGGRLERVVHVSTAYVAGATVGPFHEDDLDRGQEFRNPYERSKYEGERLVADAEDLPTVVARPSIVVGDSQTGWTPSFNVIYGPLRAFDKGLVTSLPLALDGLLDIVPVDYVADALVALAEGGVAGERYHLVAGNRATTNGDLLDLACRTLRRARPVVTLPGDGDFAPVLTAYAPYFTVRAPFDDRRARRLLEPQGVSAPAIDGYFERLMAFARATRWGRLPLSRPEAARALAERAA
ncbi:MAG: Male sterility domain protein [Solirubrobacterales bacterium]|nr:Male sterility domain protein [Solirubrobacterales bacterium]